MSAIDLERRAWVGEAAGAMLRDIRGLWVDPATGTIVTVAAQTLVAMRVFEGTGPALVSVVNFSDSLTRTLADDLYTLPGGGGSTRLILGDDGTGLWGYDISSAGQFGPMFSMPAPQAGRLDLQALVAGPGNRVYSAGSDAAGIGAMTNIGSRMNYAGFTLDNEGVAASGVTALATLHLGGRDFLIAGASAEAAVSAWEINPVNGTLTHADSLGANRTLGILRNTTDLETAIVGGRALAVVASTSSTASMGALTVLELTENGQLTALDHILDTRDTRFGGIQSLSIAEAHGRTYVAAGGGDDGVSLFVLMPTGRLVHVASFEDQLNNGLDNVAEVALLPIGSEMQIIVTSQGEGGVTQLVFDLPAPGVTQQAGDAGGQLHGSAGGDALAGGTGADFIYGWDGDDILFDGSGRDTLHGGAGSDVFSLSGDGIFDQIADFNPTLDWLDLSGLPMLYDTSQLTVQSTSSGATLRWRGEVLDLVSAFGGALSAQQVHARILTMPDRPALVTPRRFTGTDESEAQDGHEGQDEMMGQGGHDTLNALAGDDTLRGGDGYDSLHSGQGNDLVLGGNGRDKARLGMGNDRFEDSLQDDIHGADTILADAGDDTVIGWGGDDMIFGHAGWDVLAGGIGNDKVYGGDGSDTLNGGPGNDLIVGGNGQDLVTMGPGNDIFYDNAQGGEYGSDTIWAGSGNDTVEGGNGNDVMHGEADFDLLIGRLGNDSLYGGAQDDVLAGGEGDDLVFGGLGQDRAWLGPGNDIYYDDPQSDAFGADRVWGGAGNDTIDAGGGNDTLWGDGGQDVFVFSVGPGERIIMAFEPGIDKVHISGQSSAFIRQTSDGIVVDWQEGQVLLDGITFSTLQTGDLVFI